MTCWIDVWHVTGREDSDGQIIYIYTQIVDAKELFKSRYDCAHFSQEKRLTRGLDKKALLLEGAKQD